MSVCTRPQILKDTHPLPSRRALPIADSFCPTQHRDQAHSNLSMLPRACHCFVWLALQQVVAFTLRRAVLNDTCWQSRCRPAEVPRSWLSSKAERAVARRVDGRALAPQCVRRSACWSTLTRT